MSDVELELELAQEIRKVDGSNSLGASRLAEALVPFIKKWKEEQDRSRAADKATMKPSVAEPTPPPSRYVKESNR